MNTDTVQLNTAFSIKWPKQKKTPVGRAKRWHQYFQLPDKKYRDIALDIGNIFRRFQNWHAITPRFLAENLTMFYLDGKHCFKS